MSNLRILVENHAGLRRRHVFTAGVPAFADDDGRTLVAGNGDVPPQAWSRVSDTLERIDFELTLEGYSSHVLTVEAGDVPPPTFSASPWFGATGAAANPRIVVDGDEVPINLLDGGRADVLFDSPMRRVLLFTERVPDTLLLWQFLIDIARDSDVVGFWTALRNSDPSRPETHEHYAVAELRVAHAGGQVGAVGDYLAKRHMRARIDADDFVFEFPRDQTFADGQGLAFRGRLLFHRPDIAVDDAPLRLSTLAAATSGNAHAMCLDWPGESFGGFDLPAIPQYTDAGKLAAWCADQAVGWTREPPAGDRWRSSAPFAIPYKSGFTGAHPTYGLRRMTEDVIGATTARFDAVLFGIDEEVRRPCANFNEDGGPVNLALRKNVRIWDGRPHKDHKDWLGKGRTLAEWDTNGCWGPDVAHWVLTYYTAIARLTCDSAAQLLLQQHMSLFTRNFSIGESRAIGRCFVSMIQALGAAPDAFGGKLRANVVSHLHWLADRTVVFINGHAEEVAVSSFDYSGRNVPASPAWLPFQEADAIVGMYLAARYLERDDLLSACARVSRTFDLYAWDPARGYSQIGKGLAYNGGAPLTTAQYADPNLATWGDQTAFRSWAAGALQVGELLAQQHGDAEWIERNALLRQQVIETRPAPVWPEDARKLDDVAHWSLR